MEPIVLENQTRSGERLQAIFLPGKGMNMTSFKKGELEIIDQTTEGLFQERFAGLGALIGPHFHRRRPQSIPKIKDETRFPHISRVRAKGVQDPFSHGISRYAPWKAEATKTTIKAVLTGKDMWNDHSLAELEGQNFTIAFDIQLKKEGLFLDLSVVSDTDSLIGIHYYYNAPHGGQVIASVDSHMQNQKNERVPIPAQWLSSPGQLQFDLSQEADFTFRPSPNPLETSILLKTDAYSLQTNYSCACQENSWQLYRPAGSSFVCIEPISSQDPRHPNLSVSSLKIRLQIL